MMKNSTDQKELVVEIENNNACRIIKNNSV